MARWRSQKKDVVLTYQSEKKELKQDFSVLKILILLPTPFLRVQVGRFKNGVREKGETGYLMSDKDVELEYNFLMWANTIEESEARIGLATRRFRKILKSKHEKLTKERMDEIATILGDLQGTVETSTDMLKHYLK